MIEQLHAACGHPLSAHDMDGVCKGNVGGRPCPCATDALAWRYLAVETVEVLDRVIVRDEAGAFPDDPETPAIPDRIAAVQAWRAWSWSCGANHDDALCGDSRLHSVVQSQHVWPPNEALRATCALACDPVSIEEQRRRAEYMLRTLDGRRSEYQSAARRVYLGPSLNVPGTAGSLVGSRRQEVREWLIVIRPGGGHEVPMESCSCGIYAHKSRRYVIEHYDRGVVGIVALWGKVIEGERGWRATFAKPVMLAAPADLVGPISGLYSDCLVIDRDRLERSRLAERLEAPPVDAPNPERAGGPAVWLESFREAIEGAL